MDPIAQKHSLSSAQLPSWTAWRYFPNHALESSLTRLEWHAHIDPTLFRAAFQHVVSTNDALRLVFGETDGTPWQKVLCVKDMRDTLEIKDFSQTQNPRSEAEAWLDQMVSQPFDLTLRSYYSAMARVGKAHWLFQINAHHAVLDFHAKSLLISRLDEAYREVSRGEKTAPENCPSYLGYLAERPKSEPRPETQPAEPLDPFARATPLLPREPRSLQMPRSVIRQTRLLGPKRVASLRRAAGLENTKQRRFHTPLAFHACVAVTLVMMSRVSGEPNVQMGVASSGRFDKASKNVMGQFATTVPLSLQLNTDWGLSDLIKNVRASWKTALRASRNTPSQIGPALPVSVNFIPDLMPDFLGSPSRQLFGSMAPSAIGSDLNLRFVPQASGDIEVVLRIAEDAREKLGHLDLLGLWVRVMDELLAGKALSDVSLSGDAEHDAAHDAAALAYSAPAPTHKTLVSAFLAQVAVNPSRIAVRDGAASVRFDELEQMSHKIALALMQRGVGKGDVIATCLPRSANVVAAMLGILRTGAAYYSIDTRLPAERLEATLVESQAKLVICARGMPTAGLGAVSTVEVEQLLKDNSETRALPAINPHSAMYVMFTSGSTGVPNGVRVPHESFMRYQAWAISLLTDSADQPLNWSLSTSLAFESAYRSFVTLQTGGTMHCYDAPDHVTGMSAVHALEDDQCDGIALTPSHLRQLVHKRWDVKRLSKLISIGEPLSIELAHKTRAAFPDVDLINLYGPTESTMAITAHFFQADRDKTATVPIGRCPPDAVVHVLDPSLRPVPPGIPGEIVVGGPRLSLGYLNNPALMTQRFVDDPFYQGGTLYRTGDVGIVTERGDLLHLGRQDTQVKINGQRVELGEVEAAVMRHPDIMDCAVIAVKNNQDATDELVAFYVSPDHPPVADIRQTAATMLARTIMPRAYVRIDEVPHLPSGKTDRLRLQKMLKDKPRREEQGFGAPPKGNTEVQLAQLWSDILKQTSISRDDDFFDLGGDSLSFMRMILSLERHFDLKLPLERLTAATTLKAVAHWLSGSIEPKTRTRRKPVVENRSAKEVPVSSLPIEELSEDAEFEHVQHRIMLATENWPGRHMGRKMPIMAQNETGSDQALIWCFNARHEPASLGPLLGPTRPLYALRSMNAIVARGASRERFKQAFVAAYAAELMDLLPGQSLLMGGNCQSARLIVSLAQEIVHRGGQVDRICLLEHAPNETLNFNLSLFFGRDSVTHNPFLHSAEPQKEWKRLFPSVTWDVIPGQHGEYFQPGHIEEFAAKLEQRLQVRKDL